MRRRLTAAACVASLMLVVTACESSNESVHKDAVTKLHANTYPELGVKWGGEVHLFADDGPGIETGPVPESRVDELSALGKQVASPQSDILGVEFMNVDGPGAGTNCYPIVLSDASLPQQGPRVSPDTCKDIWSLVVTSGAFTPDLDLAIIGK